MSVLSEENMKQKRQGSIMAFVCGNRKDLNSVNNSMMSFT